MSETQSAAPSAQPANLSIADAAKKLGAQREAGQSEALSAAHAAGKLAEQRTADARLARRPQPVEVIDGESDEEGEEPPPSAPAPEAPLIESEDTGADGLIDLGDGVTVTLEQVREGFMLKADHTRKTQALAEERRALERERKDKLSRLDEALTRIQEQSGPPKPLQAFLAEDPARGLQRFVEQVDGQQRLAAAREQVRREREDHLAAARKARDEQLSSGYWESKVDAEKGIGEATAYAKSYGYDDASLADLLTDASVIMVLDKARKFDELRAGRSRLERMVADKPKVVRPGAKVSAQAAHQSAVHAARGKLKSTGSLSDAVAYLQAQRKPRRDS